MTTAGLRAMGGPIKDRPAPSFLTGGPETLGVWDRAREVLALDRLRRPSRELLWSTVFGAGLVHSANGVGSRSRSGGAKGEGGAPRHLGRRDGPAVFDN